MIQILKLHGESWPKFKQVLQYQKKYRPLGRRNYSLLINNPLLILLLHAVQSETLFILHSKAEVSEVDYSLKDKSPNFRYFELPILLVTGPVLISQIQSNPQI
jgi:hypothetical protein